MKKQLITWQLAAKSLQQHIPVMLLYVLQSEGSSPGRAGFFMVVNSEGETEGSIGGGIMEHKFVEMAKERLSEQDTKSNAVIKKQHHDKSAAKNQSGMICSGEQTNLLYTLQEKDAATILQLTDSLQLNKNGSLQLSPAGMQFSDTPPASDHYFEMTSEQNWKYVEKTGYKNHLYIVGAGHCALALSKMMAEMDFYVHLYDDRSNLKTFTANGYVHEKKVVEDYNELKDIIPAGENSYVVVMTVGYRTDDIAVRSLLNKQFRYVGLLGSKTKTGQLFAQYEKEGIPVEQYQSIYAPIGIPISSQSPEEIAVSIAAEIIQVKNT
jgi:xanthine dehydrogenase accessory factor